METKEQRRARIDRDSAIVFKQMDVLTEAIKAGKHGDEIEKIVTAMPLFPKAAKSAVMMMGKKTFLEKGYDRTLADAEWGEGWLDEVNDQRYKLTGLVE